MILSLGRNGFAESLSVTRHRRPAAILPRRLRHENHLSCAADRLLWQASGRVAAFRLLSTTPPSTTKTPSQDTPQPIPPLPLRKQKIELRPAPVKPPKVPPTPIASSSTPKSVSPEQGVAEKASSSASVHTASSVVETTKHDYEDASQHGILVPPPENASWAMKLFHQAKELFKFYMRGLKLIYTNRKRVQDMHARVQAGGPPLTRWETRFIRTYKQDALKLIPFALIIIVIEEIIPLIVLYAPFILPSTCVLPSQKDRIDAKKREKQKTFVYSMRPVFEAVQQRASANPGISAEALLDHEGLISITGLLSLSTFGPRPVRLYRLKRHLEAIAADDALLKHEDMGRRLTQSELREALTERGIITDELTPKLWQSRLHWWLTRVDEASGADPISRRVLLVASSGLGKF